MKTLLILFIAGVAGLAAGIRGGYIDGNRLSQDVKRKFEETFGTAEKRSPNASPQRYTRRSPSGSAVKDFHSVVEGSRSAPQKSRATVAGDAREFAGASADLVREGWKFHSRPSESINRLRNDPRELDRLEGKVQRAFKAAERVDRHVERAASSIGSLFSR